MTRKNYPLTVKQLLSECLKQVKSGNGDKYVLISDDEEGNGYHECYFSFGDGAELDDPYMDCPYDLDLKKCVLLG